LISDSSINGKRQPNNSASDESPNVQDFFFAGNKHSSNKNVKTKQVKNHALKGTTEIKDEVVQTDEHDLLNDVIGEGDTSNLDMFDGRDRKLLQGRLTDGYKLTERKLSAYSKALDKALAISFATGDVRGINSTVRTLQSMVNQAIAENSIENGSGNVQVNVTFGNND